MTIRELMEKLAGYQEDALVYCWLSVEELGDGWAEIERIIELENGIGLDCE